MAFWQRLTRACTTPHPAHRRGPRFLCQGRYTRHRPTPPSHTSLHRIHLYIPHSLPHPTQPYIHHAALPRSYESTHQPNRAQHGATATAETRHTHHDGATPQHTGTMALISARTIITSISLFHMTMAYFMIFNPRTVDDQILVYILGRSMGLVRADETERWEE